MVNVVFGILVGIMVGGLIALVIAYEEIENTYIKNHTKQKAGYKAAFTRTKKNLEIAKKILRRGRG